MKLNEKGDSNCVGCHVFYLRWSKIRA